MTRDEISTALRKLIAEKKTIARPPVPASYPDEANFIDDLGFDSLDNIEFVMAVEDRFRIEVPDDAAENIVTVGQAVDYLCRVLGAEAVGA